MASPIRIANCSGFYGDRLSAASEMVNDGPIDVLTGDWLAELTMLILARTQAKNPGSGFARSFVKQMEQVTQNTAASAEQSAAAAEELNAQAEAMNETAAKLKRYLAPEVLIIDDMGLKQLPKNAGEHLFEIIMRRSELHSTILTSNRPLSDWGKLIGDVPTAGAILDRLLSRAHVIEISGRSYRLREKTCGKKTDDDNQHSQH